MIFLKKSCLGIDVRRNTIRVVEVTKIKKQISVRYTGTSHSCCNKPQLMHLLAPCQARRAVLCLSTNEVTKVRIMLKKPLTPLEIEYHIEQHIETYIPRLTQSDYYDYTVNDDGQGNIVIDLLASPQSYIDPLLDVLTSHNIHLAFIRVDDGPCVPTAPGLHPTLSLAYALGRQGLEQ